MLGSLAAAPALPLHEAGKYVAAAYIVAFALILIYVAIMATRLSRIERELGELLMLTERDANPLQTPAPALSATAARSRQPVGAAREADELDIGRPGSTVP
jgi:CcmD family protein